MRQHFLPQSYQAGFTDPNVPDGHKPYVWIVSRGDGSWRKRAPKKVAWITDLHTLNLPDGTRDDSVETQFGAIETRFAAALRHDVTTSLWGTQMRADIATFISALFVRSPRFFREFVPQILASEKTLRFLSSKVPKFSELLRDKFASAGIVDIPSWFSTLSPDAQKAVVFTVVLPVIPADAEKLYNRTWVAARTSPSKPFVTSDTPICFFRADGTERPIELRPFDDPKTAVAVPLSATLALFSFRGSTQKLVTATDEVVALLNRQIILQSREFILSPQPTFPADEDVASWLAGTPSPDLSRLTNRLLNLPDLQ